MRVFKSRRFHKFARKEKMSDAMLCEAVEHVERGLTPTLELASSSNVWRGQALEDQAGYRTLVFFQAETRAVFVFGFAKSDLANLEDDEEAAFKKAAQLVLGFSEAQMEAEIAAGRMLEVNCDG